MTEVEKSGLQRHLNDEELARKYQGYINYITNGDDVDKSEYSIFQEYYVKNDTVALMHAYLNQVYTFKETYNKLQMIIGYDLLLQGLMDVKKKELEDAGNTKAK